MKSQAVGGHAHSRDFLESTAIAEKHYGSRQVMMDAAKKRNEVAPTLSTSLAREVTLK